MSSFWDQLTGSAASDASNAAAGDTYAKQMAAANASRDAGNTYNTNMQGASQNYNPYVNAGNSALTQLMGGLGLGGQGGSQAFTDAYHALPGYQSGLDTGTNAAISAANAGGMLQSGATMKALQRYGSDYENQHSGDYLTRLAQLGGQGLSATGAQTGVQTQGYGGQLQGNMAGANQQYSAADTIGQGQVAGANAEAQGAGNLLSTGLKLGGMALGAGGFGGAFGQGGMFGSPIAGLMSQGQTSYNGGWASPSRRA